MQPAQTKCISIMTLAWCAYGALASPRQALHVKWAAAPAASFMNSRGFVCPRALAALTLNAAAPSQTGGQLYSTFMTSVHPNFKATGQSVWAPAPARCCAGVKYLGEERGRVGFIYKYFRGVLLVVETSQVSNLKIDTEMMKTGMKSERLSPCWSCTHIRQYVQFICGSLSAFNLSSLSKWWLSLQILSFQSSLPHPTVMKLTLLSSFLRLSPLFAFSNLNRFSCVPQGVPVNLVFTWAAVT